MSRNDIHNRIDELLGLLSIHNSRLSLHTEKLSQLDIDVLRKQCIDLYDQVNMLALQGKITIKNTPIKKAPPKIQEKVIKEEITEVQSPVKVPKPESKPSPPEHKPVVEEVKTEKPITHKSKPKPKADDEMLSLFEKFSSKPIDSIPKSISVAKRFEFQNEFFDGDGKAYNLFIKELDTADSRDDAFKIYHEAKSKYGWENDDLRDELKALMYRKYS